MAKNKVKLAKLEIVSVAKISALTMAILGLVMGVFAAIGFSFLMPGLGVLAIIAFPIALAIYGFIVGAISAVIYNIVAGAVGGIELEFEE